MGVMCLITFNNLYSDTLAWSAVGELNLNIDSCVVVGSYCEVDIDTFSCCDVGRSVKPRAAMVKLISIFSAVMLWVALDPHTIP